MQDRITVLLNYLRDDPGDPFLMFALAQEYAGRNDTGNALTWYTKLREEHPEYVGTYYHLGKLQELLENPEEAVETYRIGMEMAQKAGDLHARGELAGALAMIEDTE